MGRYDLKPDYIFESSWEVCNKVGGIYTVLSTRAKTLQDMMKDRIIFIGPDFGGDVQDCYFEVHLHFSELFYRYFEILYLIWL